MYILIKELIFQDMMFQELQEVIREIITLFLTNYMMILSTMINYKEEIIVSEKQENINI